MGILQLQEKSGLPLVDIWLGVLLADDYCFHRDGGDFYSIDGVLIEQLPQKTNPNCAKVGSASTIKSEAR